MGWNQKRRFARPAQNEFHVLITVDRKISEEQDLTKFGLAVMLLRAATNRLEHLRPLAGRILEKLADAPAGAITVVSS